MPASGSIQSQSKSAGEQQAHDHEHGDCRVGHDVDHGGAHVVVAGRRSVRVLMLFEDDGIILLADPHMRRKSVRFGNLVDRFQIAALISHRENLPRAVRAHGFEPTLLVPSERRPIAAREPETRRHAVLEHFEDDDPGIGRDAVRLVMVMPIVRAVPVAVMMPAAAQEPRTCDVHGQAETGNRDRLGEMDRDGSQRCG